MTAIHRITQLLASHRGGMNAAVDAEVRGIAKTNDEGPFTIANEMIAARIGQTLGLPVPAGVIVESDAKKLYYFSLDVSYDQAKLPPIIPADFVRDEPDIAAGCVVFDILIANGDRNTTNLARDPNFDPPRPSVFDHGHALLGTNPPTGGDRLDRAKDKLGCDGTDDQLGTCSVLLPEIDNAGRLENWSAGRGAADLSVRGHLHRDCPNGTAQP